MLLNKKMKCVKNFYVRFSQTTFLSLIAKELEHTKLADVLCSETCK